MAYYNYYPFGMLQPNRNGPGTKSLAGGYRYGYNGKEMDNNGELGLTSYDYGFRIYNPGIAKFLSVDPLSVKYPMLTPYQFASDSPIAGIDQDGLEFANANANAKAARYGVNSLRILRVDEGMGDVQSQLYSLKAHGNTQDFIKLRDTFLSNPQLITNNFYATYAPIGKENPGRLEPNDNIKIDFHAGFVPILTTVFVRVMAVQPEKTATSFEMTFATLEGHTDAGYITFAGSFNPETNEIVFTIYNETRDNHGLGHYSTLGRKVQTDQWQDVIGNVRKFLGKSKEDSQMTEDIKSYEYDEAGDMGKGKLLNETKETIDE